jgi:uroporphyrinogen III methyltransferase / synthase
VEHFLDHKLALPEKIKIASIGPITSKPLTDRGLRVDIEAKEHSIPGLVAAIERHFAPDH